MIDQFLSKYRQRAEKSPSQLAEIKKHAKIAEKRDPN